MATDPSASGSDILAADMAHARLKSDPGWPPQKSDKIGAALDDAETLVRHIARSGKGSDEEPVFLDVAQARDAWKSNRWTAEIEARFWVAQSKLAELAKPVTLESLAAERRAPRNA